MVSREALRERVENQDADHLVGARRETAGEYASKPIKTLHRPADDSTPDDPEPACHQNGTDRIEYVAISVEELCERSDATLDSITWCNRVGCYGDTSTPSSTCRFCGEDVDSNMANHIENECPVLNPSETKDSAFP